MLTLWYWLLGCVFVKTVAYPLAFKLSPKSLIELQLIEARGSPLAVDCQHQLHKRALDLVDLDIPLDELNTEGEDLQLAEVNIFRPVFAYRMTSAHIRELRNRRRRKYNNY